MGARWIVVVGAVPGRAPSLTRRCAHAPATCLTGPCVWLCRQHRRLRRRAAGKDLARQRGECGAGPGRTLLLRRPSRVEGGGGPPAVLSLWCVCTRLELYGSGGTTTWKEWQTQPQVDTHAVSLETSTCSACSCHDRRRAAVHPSAHCRCALATSWFCPPANARHGTLSPAAAGTRPTRRLSAGVGTGFGGAVVGWAACLRTTSVLRLHVFLWLGATRAAMGMASARSSRAGGSGAGGTVKASPK